MINYTKRLDSAIKRAAWAHEKQGQHRNGTDVPYIIHPFGVMAIASNYTDDEDILVSCLLHDILEDVSSEIYNEFDMNLEFGEKVVSIVKDVTKNDDILDWHDRSRAYLNHLNSEACQQAVIVSVSDKMHNLYSTLADYEIIGDKLWVRFATKNCYDQLWWYQSILKIANDRSAIASLNSDFADQVAKLEKIVSNQSSLVSLS